MKLNLGCGEHKIKGYINCDILEEVKPDIRLDLTKKLPFADNSIDEIYMNHVLEHILNYGFLLNEIWRVCKKNSKITIHVPFYASQNNLQVPEHINSFGYFSLVNYKKLFIIQPHLDFFIAKKNKFLDALINWKPYVYQRFFAWILPVSQVTYILKVIKK